MFPYNLMTDYAGNSRQPSWYMSMIRDPIDRVSLPLRCVPHLWVPCHIPRSSSRIRYKSYLPTSEDLLRLGGGVQPGGGALRTCFRVGEITSVVFLTLAPWNA